MSGYHRCRGTEFTTSVLDFEQIIAEGHVAVLRISTTLDIVKVVVAAAAKAPG